MSCNKTQQVLIPKHALKQEEQANHNTTIAEVKSNTTASRPKYIFQQNGRTIAHPEVHPESKFDHNPFAFSDAVKKGQGFVYTLYNEVVEGWGCLINIKENTTPTKERVGIRYMGKNGLLYKEGYIPKRFR